MNYPADNVLKMKEEDAVVFSTNIKLSKRFSNCQPSSVILTNGFTVTCENNQSMRRVVFGYRPCVNNRFRWYRSGCVERTKIKGEERQGEQLDNVAKKRRVVLIPKKAKAENPIESSLNTYGNEETSQFENIKSSTPKKSESDNAYRRDSVKRHFNGLDEEDKEHDSSDEVKSSIFGDANSIGTSSDQNDDSKEPIIFSPCHLVPKKHRKFSFAKNRRQLKKAAKERLFKRGQLIIKEDLDREIDEYMAEVKLTSPVQPEDDVDSFVQEYEMEIGKY